MERMKELLDRLDYTVSGLEKAGNLYEIGDFDGCMEAVAEHFRTRTTPTYLFDAGEMTGLKDDQILAEAEEVIQLKLDV